MGWAVSHKDLRGPSLKAKEKNWGPRKKHPVYCDKWRLDVKIWNDGQNQENVLLLPCGSALMFSWNPRSPLIALLQK